MKVNGILYTKILIDCPKCEDIIDLFEIDYMNDEGQLWGVIDCWKKDKGWENLDMKFDCPKCKSEITFDTLEY